MSFAKPEMALHSQRNFWHRFEKPLLALLYPESEVHFMETVIVVSIHSKRIN